MERAALPPDRQRALAALRREATLRYGEDAVFTYFRPSQNTAATLTLSQAIEICGQHIASGSHEAVFATLDRMFAMANRLKTEKPQMFSASQAMGRHILKRYETDN